MRKKTYSTEKNILQRDSSANVFNLTAKYQNPTGTQRERFQTALGIYATLLSRLIIKRVNQDESESSSNVTKSPLISDQNHSTVGTPTNSIYGDSDK